MESASKKQHQIPSDVLDDLASRFIINIPEEEKFNLIRIMFQVELAHWFFLDFLCSQKFSDANSQKLVSCGIKQFTVHLFQHVPFLNPHLANVDKVLEDWKQYKLSVPTYGAILISEDLKHVLLVQSYFAKSSWGFPKGKINENEDPVHCAVREVYEETGYDISKHVKANEYIELVMNFQHTRLYLVTGVKIGTKFEPKTRNEIKCCEWFPIDLLPTNKNQVEAKTNLGVGPNSFFMILPFIKRLKKWLKDFDSRKEARQSQKKNSRNVSTFNYGEDANSSGFFFPDNAKGSQQGVSQRRLRHKSTGDVENGGGFKLANFGKATSTPKDTRRKLVFENSQNLSGSKREGRRSEEHAGGLFFEGPFRAWADVKLDRQKLIEAVLCKLQHIQ